MKPTISPQLCLEIAIALKPYPAYELASQL